MPLRSLLPMKTLLLTLILSAGVLHAAGPGPIVGEDGIRRYFYSEQLTRSSDGTHSWGVDGDTLFTRTNRWDFSILANWNLEDGGSRRFLERSYWDMWDSQACGNGQDLFDEYSAYVVYFDPWNVSSSTSYRTYTRTWIKPCLPSDIQNTGTQPGPDSGIDTFAGGWIQRRQTNSPPAVTWSVPPPVWETGWGLSREIWNQTTRIQLTTGRSPYKHAGSYFFIYPKVYDLDRQEAVPHSEVRIAGNRVSSDGRVLVYSINNAGYNQMRDVTPSVPTRKSFRFDVRQMRTDYRTGAVNSYGASLNPVWPGARPGGMPQRMQYPSGTTPTDEQILWDVLSNSPLGPQMVSAANSVLALSSPAVSVASSGGKLTQTGVADRQWLTLAFLSRTANPVSPATLSTNELDQRVINARSTFRLINEFRVMTVPDGNQFAVAETERRRAAIGQTAVTLLAGVSVRVQRADGSTQTLPITASQANLILQTAGVGSNASAAGNATVIGGVGSSEYRANAAMQGGILPACVHDLIVRGPRRDLSTSTAFQASADQVVVAPLPSTCTWPAPSLYLWDESSERYVKTTTDSPATSPFDCYLTINP